jgi:hypothetical protein
LLVGPGLISRNQDLRFTVIAADKPVILTCRSSLINVDVRPQSLTPHTRGRFAILTVFATMMLALILANAVVRSFGVRVQPWIQDGILILAGVSLGYWVHDRYRWPGH